MALKGDVTTAIKGDSGVGEEPSAAEPASSPSLGVVVAADVGAAMLAPPNGTGEVGAATKDAGVPTGRVSTTGYTPGFTGCRRAGAA